MARVVQQRSNPPYLLILFVFLFLIASVLAVFQFVAADKAAQQTREEQEMRAKLASDAQVSEFARVIDRFDGKQTSTVIGHLKGELESRNAIIVGKSRAEEAEIAAAQEEIGRLANLGMTGNVQVDLVGLLKRANDEIAAVNARLAKRDEEEASLKAIITAKEAEIKDRDAKLAAELDKAKASFDKAQKDRATAEAALKGEIAKMQKQKETETAMLNKNIADQARKIQELERELNKTRTELATFKASQQQSDDEKTAFEVPASVHAAGSVTRIVERAGICYIDIGRDQKVKPGITFSIFDPNAAFNSDVAKANVVVDNVFDTFSVCRILSTDAKQRIRTSDVVVNPTFSKQHSLKFAVQGMFDLHGNGKASQQGTAEVKALITRNGGQVVDQVFHDIDYLVVGEVPPQPAPARDDEPPAVTAAREEMMRDIEAFNAAIEEAKKLQIPILNATRFLVLTGYESAAVGSR